MNFIFSLAPPDLGTLFTCDFEDIDKKLFDEPLTDDELYRAFIGRFNVRQYAAARGWVSSASRPVPTVYQQRKQRGTGSTPLATPPKSPRMQKVGTLPATPHRHDSILKSEEEFKEESEEAECTSADSTRAYTPEDPDGVSVRRTPSLARSSFTTAVDSPHSSTASAHSLSHKTKSRNLRLAYERGPIDQENEKKDEFCVCGSRYHYLHKTMIQCADCDDWYHLRCVDQEHTRE